MQVDKRVLEGYPPLSTSMIAGREKESSERLKLLIILLVPENTSTGVHTSGSFHFSFGKLNKCWPHDLTTVTRMLQQGDITCSFPAHPSKEGRRARKQPAGSQQRSFLGLHQLGKPPTPHTLLIDLCVYTFFSGHVFFFFFLTKEPLPRVLHDRRFGF